MVRFLYMSTRRSLLLGPLALAFSFAACGKQGPGDRCSVDNGDDDCRSGLLCTRINPTVELCCPSAQTNVSSIAACTIGVGTVSGVGGAGIVGAGGTQLASGGSSGLAGGDSGGAQAAGTGGTAGTSSSDEGGGRAGAAGSSGASDDSGLE